MTRAEQLRSKAPELIADVTLYATTNGGRKHALHPGWGCPCMVSNAEPLIGWDGWPILEGPMVPGEQRRLGFVFLSGEEAADIFRKAGMFYLWEGGFIGEAVVVS